MTKIEEKNVERREEPLRIWASYSSFRSGFDIVIDPSGNRELVFHVNSNTLQTIARIGNSRNISLNDRILESFDLYQMKPVKSVVYYEGSQDILMMALYKEYQNKLNDAGIKNE